MAKSFSECLLMLAASFDLIAEDLANKGYGVYDGVFAPELIHALAQESDSLADGAGFKLAGVGRKQEFVREESVRSDSIQWLDSQQRAAALFLVEMETLRLAMNQRLYLGLFDYEAHYARYAEGAFYKRHLDAFRGKGLAGVNRKLSTVLYLNETWDSSWGGELVVYHPESDNPLEKVVPTAGRLVIFLSEEFPHEVLPATRERKSIAGWFRVNEGKL